MANENTSGWLTLALLASLLFNVVQAMGFHDTSHLLDVRNDQLKRLAREVRYTHGDVENEMASGGWAGFDDERYDDWPSDAD
jgi:hypothetical protein